MPSTLPNFSIPLLAAILEWAYLSLLYSAAKLWADWPWCLNHAPLLLQKNKHSVPLVFLICLCLIYAIDESSSRSRKRQQSGISSDSCRVWNQSGMPPAVCPQLSPLTLLSRAFVKAQRCCRLSSWSLERLCCRFSKENMRRARTLAPSATELPLSHNNSPVKASCQPRFQCVCTGLLPLEL